MPLPTTAAEVWNEIEKWPFAVLGFVNPSGEPRAAGVMYVAQDRRINVVTGPSTWKVRHIRGNPNVSVTVTVQRLPIRIRQAPPAVITFAGLATILPMDDVEPTLRKDLMRGIDETMGEMCAIRIEPVGRFVTYGIGVPLLKMRTPGAALARVPVN
jgi:hypothetical protein